MLDTKVLAAVLVSLAAASIIVNGGNSFSMDEGLNFDEFTSADLSPRNLGAFTGLIDRRDSDTPVKADLNFNGSLPQQVRLSSADLSPNNLTEITDGDRTIRSKTSFTLEGFSGTVTLDKPLTLDGTAQRASSNGVEISGSFQIREQVSSDRLVIENVTRSDFSLDTVEGDIESGSTSASISGTQLSADSFSGDLSFDFVESRLEMNGTVGRLDAGSVSLGN
ncbi:hypothetical protein [Candidatus Nanohalococcus occultus]|uniref:hypothetical protein n=1 Tax=Candidatus Nanohalococcus occultus TaxID=2978047 RepID=UPI0039DFA551